MKKELPEFGRISTPKAFIIAGISLVITTITMSL